MWSFARSRFPLSTSDTMLSVPKTWWTSLERRALCPTCSTENVIWQRTTFANSANDSVCLQRSFSKVAQLQPPPCSPTWLRSLPRPYHRQVAVDDAVVSSTPTLRFYTQQNL